ncbi:phosphoribosylamine--glycine ligase [uncultured Martelella sp.]|uniref:phosphoribosylamine--glycine ligase n=1 Tax=uncultured Martelella sp. TaxID=392331 RepID=UPI0029C68928|nr:phosphoribosylamine--glycine ligase [uncultured Martelella sp.]
MNVLLIGSGGREHALAWKLSQSPRLTTLYAAPGNPGMADHATCVALDVADHAAIVAFCGEKDIALVVVGPEAPLVDGLVDSLTAAGIRAFGPTKAAAQLEGSKGFTKDLCARYDIPTGAYRRFDNAEDAKAYVGEIGAPIVIKADGLAAGKGVTVARTNDEALAAIDDCFSGTFGAAGAEVVVEEFLVGEEASFFCLSDGKNALPLATAQDHKAVGDGDTGPNTGGMGAYSPAPVMDAAMIARTMAEIIEPTIRGMAEMGHPFQGVLYAGLMITEKGPELIEYNARFGDPECQVLMMRLQSDLLDILDACAGGTLDKASAEWSDQTALTVVMATKGYPGSYKKGSEIKSLPQDTESARTFHAGTAVRDNKLVANGGRVLNITALGHNVTEAQTHAYELIEDINWPEGFCRRDIGWRAVAREEAKD